MPELPEIETLVLELRPKLSGRTVSRALIFRKTRLFKVSPEILKSKLPGKKVASVSRRGKFLFLNLEPAGSLVFHLGMTGRLFWSGRAEKDPHLHFGLEFEGVPEKLFFRDIRRFGGIYFWTGSEAVPEGIHKLGREPFALTAAQFKELLKPRKGRIKSMLLDQRLVAGLGNIYADEALFRSGLDPRRRPFRVPAPRLEALHQAVCDVLQEAVRWGGSSIDDYVHSDGSPGRFQEHHRVYGRAGNPCKVCGVLIRRIVIAGRSSFFCPECQK